MFGIQVHGVQDVYRVLEHSPIALVSGHARERMSRSVDRHSRVLRIHVHGSWTLIAYENTFTLKV